MEKSRPLRPYLAIVAELVDRTGLSQLAIAKIMGWRSDRALANKLRGIRKMQTKELQKLCTDVLGITLVDLASQSSDLVLTRTPEASEAAILIDGLPSGVREQAMESLRKLSPKPKP